MATSVQISKFTIHSRSISLPTSLHHLLANSEEQLQRLKSYEGASSSLSHTSTCHKLNGLRNLYECLDDLVQQNGFTQHERKGTWEEEILDRSVMLLDICGTTKEVYSKLKESIQELESSLRRKGSNIDAYMTSRKELNEMISKCFKEVKKSERICSMATVNNHSQLPLINLIKEVQEISLSVLKSSLSFISGPRNSKSPSRAWTLVSKLLKSKGESDISEIESLEMELMILHSKNDNENLHSQNILKQFCAMNSKIQEVDDILEVIFRLFLKSRVSLLNILSF